MAPYAVEPDNANKCMFYFYTVVNIFGMVEREVLMLSAGFSLCPFFSL